MNNIPARLRGATKRPPPKPRPSQATSARVTDCRGSKPGRPWLGNLTPEEKAERRRLYKIEYHKQYRARIAAAKRVRS